MRTATRFTAVTASLLCGLVLLYALISGNNQLLCLLVPLLGVAVLGYAAGRHPTDREHDVAFELRERQRHLELTETKNRGADLFHHLRASLSLYAFAEYPDAHERRRLSLIQLRRAEELFDRLIRRADLTGEPSIATRLLTIVAEGATSGRLWLLADWTAPQLERAVAEHVRTGELRRPDGTEVSLRR